MIKMRLHDGKEWCLFDVEPIEEFQWEGLNLVLHENPFHTKNSTENRYRLSHKESGLRLFDLWDKKECKACGLSVLNFMGKGAMATAILKEIEKI